MDESEIESWDIIDEKGTNTNNISTQTDYNDLQIKIQKNEYYETKDNNLETKETSTEISKEIDPYVLGKPVRIFIKADIKKNSI